MRTSVLRAATVMVAALVATWPAAVAPRAQAPADLVLVNGKVITVDAADSIAQAVAISGGRIVAVGSTAEVKARAGSATQVIDLGGRAVTPGLIDTHVHFTEVDQLFSIDLNDPAIKTMSDVVVAGGGPGGQDQARRMGDRRRLGRRQAGRAAAHHRGRPRHGVAQQPGVARQHHRPLRRRQHLRAEDRRDPQGHARSGGRHHRPQGRRRAQRGGARERPAAHHAPRARVHARAAEGRAGEDDPGLQRRGHDRRQGSRHQRAEVGALQRAPEGRKARRPGVRACGRAPDGSIRRPPCRPASTPTRARRSRSATAGCSRAA